MYIGNLARAAGVNVQTVRYYERLGLLAEPGRSTSGYRVYGENALKHLRFIKRAQALGFSLDEIKSVMELSREGKRPCASVRRLAKAKLADVDRKLQQMLAYRRKLAALIKQWEDMPDETPDAAVCQLIELSKAEELLDSIRGYKL
jgi:DNA-binding transcriptional MerR regulator